jgi:hypothetical protein
VANRLTQGGRHSIAVIPAYLTVHDRIGRMPGRDNLRYAKIDLVSGVEFRPIQPTIR